MTVLQNPLPEDRPVDASQGSSSSGAWRGTFAYDGLGRLRVRTEYLGNGSSWNSVSTNAYIYDGMRVIQERDGSNDPLVSYTRGNDLSGSLEGAGGIGGLLARSTGYTCTGSNLTVCITNTSSLDFIFSIYDDTETFVDSAVVSSGTTSCFTFDATAGTTYTVDGFDRFSHAIEVLDVFNPMLDQRNLVIQDNDGDFTASSSGDVLCGDPATWPHHDYYFADGNGNIVTLIDTNQTVSASYRYDPFGNITSQSGAMADANVYRFSSKEFHAASGLYYYGYRFYDPNLQRWANQDPLRDATFLRVQRPDFDGQYIIETASPNLYTYVQNEPISRRDPLGLIRNPSGPSSSPTSSPQIVMICDQGLQGHICHFPKPKEWCDANEDNKFKSCQAVARQKFKHWCDELGTLYDFLARRGMNQACDELARCYGYKL